MLDFFKKLFSSEGEEKKIVQFSVEEAIKATQELQEKNQKQAEEFIYPKFSEIKYLLKEIKASAQEIKAKDFELPSQIEIIMRNIRPVDEPSALIRVVHIDLHPELSPVADDKGVIYS